MIAMPWFKLKKLNMINGRFYFIQTDSGNLIGEYSNQNSIKNTPESAELLRRTEPFPRFIGDYTSTWFEEIPVSMDLKIENKKGSNQIFVLTWGNEGKTQFQGEGFLFDKSLIGNYWDIELQNLITKKR
jgi:hypothetical protein